jgi:hypothetical protein
MSDWQLTFNGLTMGPDPYWLEQVTGFHDAPDVRSTDQERARNHGQFASVDYLGGRTIQAVIEVTAPHPANDTWQALSQALVAGQATETTLTATLPGVARGVTVQVGARVRRLALPVDQTYSLGVGRANVEWHCTDPRIYAATETQLTISQATVAGTGLTFPATFPLSFGGAVTGGTVVATNSGEFPAPWTMTITGPITNPRVENITTGQTLTFDATLAAGETLVLSSLDKQILLGGTASRYSWLRFGSAWFDLVAGDNTIRLAGTAGSGTAALSFRSVWI